LCVKLKTSTIYGDWSVLDMAGLGVRSFIFSGLA